MLLMIAKLRLQVLSKMHGRVGLKSPAVCFLLILMTTESAAPLRVLAPLLLALPEAGDEIPEW